MSNESVLEIQERGENYQTVFPQRGLSIGEKLGLLVVGGGAGAILALLLAPKRGEELRGDIAAVSRKGLERGRETAASIGTHVGEYYETARTRAGEIADVTKSRASEIYQTAEEQARALAEKTRRASQNPRGTIAAAIEAGKAAYYEEKRRSEAASLVTGRPSYPYELGDAAVDAKRARARENSLLNLTDEQITDQQTSNE